MYIKLSGSAIQDKPITDKPDLAMMLRAYELYFYGIRDEEIVGIGQHYDSNFKYLNYWDFRANLDELVEWQINSDLLNACFLVNPIQDNSDQPKKNRTYEKTTVKTTTFPKSKRTDFTRVCWYLLDLDRVDALKHPAGSKDYSPATQEQLAMLAKANKALMDFLAGIGFACILNHFSGNGYGLAIPVHFVNDKDVNKKFSKMNEIIQDSLADFPEVDIDKKFACPRQPWTIPGSLNKKAGRATLRRALNYYDFTPEDLANSRQSNSMCIESHLAEAQILVAKSSQPKGKLVFNSAITEEPSEMKGFLDQWDNDNCLGLLKDLLIEHEYKAIRQRPSGAWLMQRPGKEGFGHGLIIGGQKNYLWNWSNSDPYFPVDQAIKPYWAYFILKGIVKDGKVVDDDKALDFYREVGRTYRRPFSLGRQVNFSINEIQSAKPTKLEQPPAALEPAKPIEQPEAALEPRQATGTLADIPLPGIIETIAQEIMASNPKHSPSIDRTWALSLWSFMIGKSRGYKTGLLCNSYIVNLAPSSAGKEAGKAFIHKYLEFVADKNEKENKVKGLEDGACCYGYKLLSSSSTSQGLSDEALNHGRIMITGDETERFLHPEENNRIALEVRQTLLEASNSGLIPGRALAQDGTKKTANNCFVSMIHTIQPRAYFEAFQNNQDTKGFIGRLIHFEANKGIVKHHQDINPSNFSEDLIEAGMYWQAENLKGLEHELSKITDKGQSRPSLGRFKPDRPILSASKSLQDKIHEYTLYCDELATKEMEANNGLMERFWDKNPEHCIRLAMDFTLAEDWKTLNLSLSSWDLATRIMGLSKQVLIKNQSHILKSKMSQLEEDLINYLQTFWKAGQTAPLSELWRKFRSRFSHNYKQFTEMINSLQALGMICVDPQEDKRFSQRLSKPIE
jgi:hypothetical protein